MFNQHRNKKEKETKLPDSDKIDVEPNRFNDPTMVEIPK